MKATAAVAAAALALAACGGPSRGEAPPPATTAMEMDHESGHAGMEMHEAREWDGLGPASVAIEVTAGEDEGWLVTVDVPDFAFTLGAEHVPGEGHGHLMVDGELVTMFFEPTVALGDLESGVYDVMVTLSANDHLAYEVNGAPLGAMATVEVP